jgi:hypothetical protein
MALRYRKPPRKGVYQRPDDETRAIAEKGRRGASKAIVAALKAFRSAVPVKAMAEKIAGRDLAGAADLVNIATLKHDLRGAFDALVAIHNESAQRAADAINESVNAAMRRKLRKDTTTFSGDPETPDRYAFDLYTDDVMAAIADYQDAFISAMTDDVRQTVFDAIAAGVKNGDEPSAIAASIRDVIGLNDRQAVAVQNYRAALEQNIGASLDYALRDPSADDAVAAAIDAGFALDAETIDGLVDAYVERSLDYRADMIAQTESTRAANMGLQDAYAQAIDDGVFPDDAVRQFWMLAMDEKVCDICQGIADDSADGVPIGETFESDDGEIDQPPAHPNCLHGDALVLPRGAVTAASKRWFDGNLVVIRTAGGKRLASTPNHPVLTPRGWVAANLLKKGDDVVCGLGRRDAARRFDNKDVPTRIEDIAEAFGRSPHVAPRPVPLSAEDFHGDGGGSKVAIVWADRQLRNRPDSALQQFGAERRLERRHMKLLPHNGLGALFLFLDRVFTAAHGVVRRLDLSLPFFLRHDAPLERCCFAWAADRGAGLDQAPAHNSPAQTELLGECVLAETAFVETDQIVDVDVQSFHGFVFNIETESGAYIAQGIITHNCRCTIEIRTDLDMVASANAMEVAST